MTDPANPVNPLDLPEEEQVVYELAGWSFDLQAEAAEVLAESQIPHAWDGTDLVVHLDWEPMVDELLDAVERGATGTVDESDDELVYELDEWPPEDREALVAKLAEAGVAHRWEGDDETTLVVAPGDEAVVEALLDGVEYPDAIPVEEVDDEATAAAEATSFEVLSSLFLAADRLKGNPLDADGIADLSDALEDADPDVPPFGIVPGLWRDAVERANRLADTLADNDDRSPEVAEQAAELQALLRPFV
jgi:hypothetical protein